MLEELQYRAAARVKGQAESGGQKGGELVVRNVYLERQKD